MKKKIYLGTSDFKELLSGNNYFVDKTLLIKEFMESNSKVTLIPRPRRFGKTLNMSMIKYFLEKTECDNSCLFNNLKIQNENEIMELQGKYPVIYITFKDEKYSSWRDCYDSLTILLSDLFSKFEYLINSNLLSSQEVVQYKKILNRSGDFATNCNALKNLSEYLVRFHREKVIILIDEYDVPIQEGYLNGYYDEIIEFMRNFLSGALKDNINLEKAMLTGILRVAKESIFSGLNNIDVSTLLNSKYNKYFGFTESEVEELVLYYSPEGNQEDIKEWYNGYNFGGETIYNPWSILNYLSNQEEGLRPYWINSSSNDLVRLLLTKGNEEIKQDLENLIKGEEITKTINDNIIMNEVDRSANNLWSFLLFTGYLKAYNKERKGLKDYYKLRIPNIEIKTLYYDIVESWFNDNISNRRYEIMMKSLITGDIVTFEKLFKQFIISSVSYFDVGGYEGEKVYHAFVLGMLISLNSDYNIKSNRESGYGRYDVMMIPKDKSKKGIIIEFKKLDEDDEESLEDMANDALRQIEEKKYKVELLDRGIEDILELAIVFKQKMVKVKTKSPHRCS